MISVHRRHDSKDNTWAAPTHGRPTSHRAGEARVEGIGERAACARDGRGTRKSCCCSTCASAARLSSCSGRPPQQVKPLVVKLSMVVVRALDTRRQRESRRMLRAPRTRREPTGRRGFTPFIVSQITCKRAAHDQRASSSRIRRQHVRSAPTHGRPTSRGVGEARGEGIGERAACAIDGRGPRTS